MRNTQLNEQLEHIDQQLIELIASTEQLTKNYGVDKQIKLTRVKHRFKNGCCFIGTWTFGNIQKNCKANHNGRLIDHRYPLRVRDFKRLSDKQAIAISAFFQEKDEVFIEEILRIEKNRLAINSSIQTIMKISDYLQTVQSQEYTLYEMLHHA